MEFIGIVDSHGNEIKLETLFGKDASKLSKACKNVFNNWLHPYRGCYHPDCPDAYALYKELVIPEGSNFMTEYKAFMMKWYSEHPEEAQKEADSRKEWETKLKKQFRVVYDIAKRRGLYLKWYGRCNPCCGDRWGVYKGQEQIAVISC